MPLGKAAALGIAELRLSAEIPRRIDFYEQKELMDPSPGHKVVDCVDEALDANA